MENKIIRILTCDNLTEAHLVKGRLENEGINCFLTNQNFTNLVPMYNNMMGAGIQIMIEEKNYEKAYEILQDKINPKTENIICPNCGSNNIKLGLGKYKGFKLLNIFIAIFSFLPLGNLKPKYYCKDCNSEII